MLSLSGFKLQCFVNIVYIVYMFWTDVPYGIKSINELNWTEFGVVCLPCVITWLYSTPLLFVQAIGVVVCLSLRIAYLSGSRRTRHSVVSGIFYRWHCFVLFCSLFHTMANISIFLSHWHCHINFYFPFSQFMCRCKDWNACKNLVIILYRVIKKDNSKQNRYEYCKF